MTPSKKAVTFDFCEICSVDAAICNVLSDSVYVNSLPYNHNVTQ